MALSPYLWQVLGEYRLVPQKVLTQMKSSVCDLLAKQQQVVEHGDLDQWCYHMDRTLWPYLRVSQQRFPEAEQYIIDSGPVNAVSYAIQILKGPFPEAEPMIARAPALWPLRYATAALHGPFPLGEPAIALDGDKAALYALWVLNERFKLGELAIAREFQKWATEHNLSYSGSGDYAVRYMDKILHLPTKEAAEQWATAVIQRGNRSSSSTRVASRGYRGWFNPNTSKLIDLKDMEHSLWAKRRIKRQDPGFTGSSGEAMNMLWREGWIRVATDGRGGTYFESGNPLTTRVLEALQLLVTQEPALYCTEVGLSAPNTGDCKLPRVEFESARVPDLRAFRLRGDHA